MSAFASFASAPSAFRPAQPHAHAHAHCPTSTSPLKATYIPLSPSLSATTASPAGTVVESSEGEDFGTEDEEDDRIFFGTPGEKEAGVVAKLSHGPRPSIIHSPSTPRSRPRHSVVRKRDSCEFLRRQTILAPLRPGPPLRESPASSSKATARKVWPGGFHERREAEEYDSDSSTSSSTSSLPSPTGSRQGDCDLTLDFAHFRVSDTPKRTSPVHLKLTRVPSSEAWSDEEGDSDKENCPARAEDDVEEENAQPELFDGPVIDADVFDEISKMDLALDIGGLHLADYTDEIDTSAQIEEDAFSDSTEDAGPSGPGSPVAASGSPISALLSSAGTPLSLPRTPVHFISTELVTRSPLAELPTTPITPSTPITDEALPAHRAGRVILPVPGSPYSPPSMPTDSSRLSPGTLPDTPHAAPLSTPPRARAHLAQGPQSKAFLKSALAAPATVEKIRLAASTRTLPVDAATARSQAITSQLSQASKGYVGRLGMGPPQRPGSAMSSSSSSSGTGVGGVARSNAGKAKATGATAMRKPPVPTARVQPRPGAAASKVVPASRPMTGRIPAPPTQRSGSGVSVNAIGSGATNRPPPKSTKPISRPALAPRTLQSVQITAPARSAPRAGIKPIAGAPAPHTAAGTATATVRASPRVNPLKRPMPFAQPMPARTAITTSTAASGPSLARSGLGMPSRMVGAQVFTLASTRMPTSPPSAPVFSAAFASPPAFSLGSAAPFGSLSVGRPAKSPARGLGAPAVRPAPGSVRAFKMGTPSRMRGLPPTPSKALTPIKPLCLAPVFRSLGSPIKEVPSSPASNTRSGDNAASGPSASEQQPPRGSSEDHEEVSFALAPGSSSGSSSSDAPTPPETQGSSPPGDKAVDAAPELPRTRSRSATPEPTKAPAETERKKRASARPKASALSGPASRTGAGTIAQGMSEAELKNKTARNTSMNEKRVCAIEVVQVRHDFERPPSPTSKIPTTAAKLEAEKKEGRGARAARRRAAGSDAEAEEGGVGAGAEDEYRLVVTEQREMGPGEDEAWVDERPAKRSRTDEGEGDEGRAGKRRVMWDKGVVVIRDFGEGWAAASTRNGSSASGKGTLKSVMSRERRIELDQYGNVLPSRPKVPVKPHKVVVTAVFYKGEEPYVAPSQGTRGKKKGGG